MLDSIFIEGKYLKMEMFVEGKVFVYFIVGFI